MVTLVLQIIVLVFWVIFYGVMIFKDRKNKKGTFEQSALYNKLLEKFKEKEKPFGKEGHSEYVNIIKEHDNDMVEHTIAVVEGNLQTESVNSIVMAVAQTLFSLCSLVIAKQFGTINGVDTEMLSTAISIIVIGVWLWLIAPAYITVKRQKYFLELMRFELDKKKEEQKHTRENEELEMKIKMLERENEALKNKRTRGIHITFER